MKLSAPIFYLKRKARRLSRAERIPHVTALDRIATEEGFASWSLLADRMSTLSPTRSLLGVLDDGDMLLVGARPGHGKTLFGLELLAEAMADDRRGVLFTLEYTPKDVLERFRAMDVNPARFDGRFTLECSDAICADYIAATLQDVPAGTVAVIDYLQLLDQRRSTPELGIQVRQLRDFARKAGVTLVFISQVDRAFSPTRERPLPGIGDIRLPNPLDMTLFDKACFLHDGKIEIAALN